MDIDLDWDNTILPTTFYTKKNINSLSDQIKIVFVILPNYKHLFCKMVNFNIRCLLTIYRILNKKWLFFPFRLISRIRNIHDWKIHQKLPDKKCILHPFWIFNYTIKSKTTKFWTMGEKIFAKEFSNNGKVNRNDFYCKNRLLSFVQMIILSNVNTKAMIKTFQLECKNICVIDLRLWGIESNPKKGKGNL